MALYQRIETVRDFNGVVVSRANVKVVTSLTYSDDAPLAVLYSDSAGLIPLANPLQADAAGAYSYWVNSADYYSEQISRPGYVSSTVDGFFIGALAGPVGPQGNAGPAGPDLSPQLANAANLLYGSGMVGHGVGVAYPPATAGYQINLKAPYNELAETMDPTTGAALIGYNPAITYNPNTVGAFLNGLASFPSLINTVDPLQGASLVGFNPSLTYNPNTVGSRLNDIGTADSGKGASLVGYLAPYTGAVARTQHQKNADMINLLDFGADPTGVAYSTTAINAAIATGKKVFAPKGTYLYTPPLALDLDNIYIEGEGRYATIFKPTAVAAPAFKLAGNANISSCKLTGFQILGNATCTTGISIGTSATSKYSVDNVFTDLYIKGFTKVDAAAIEIQCGWWLTLDGVASEGNYNSIRVPNGGTLTTLNTRGWCKFTNNTNWALKFEDAAQLTTATFYNTDFSSNQLGVLSCIAASAHIVFFNCYYEQNYLGAVVDHAAIFSVPGNASFPTKLVIDGGRFDTPGGTAPAWLTLTVYAIGAHVTSSGVPYICLAAHTSGTFATDLAAGKWVLVNQIYADYCKSSVVRDAIGFSYAPSLTTANSEFRFEYVNGQAASDFIALARVMLGDITVVDRQLSGTNTPLYDLETYSSRSNVFEGHIGTYQPVAPTVAMLAGGGAGSGAFIITGATDTAGVFRIIEGTSGWGTGGQATLTFSKAYNRTPTVCITPVNASAASAVTANKPYVTATAADFTINFVTAASSAIDTYWTYIVIE